MTGVQRLLDALTHLRLCGAGTELGEKQNARRLEAMVRFDF